MKNYVLDDSLIHTSSVASAASPFYSTYTPCGEQIPIDAVHTTERPTCKICKDYLRDSTDVRDWEDAMIMTGVRSGFVSPKIISENVRSEHGWVFSSVRVTAALKRHGYTKHGNGLWHHNT